MNRLRELILMRAETTGVRWDIATVNLILYLRDNAEAMADLIDAARDTGLTLRADHPLTIALDKLEK